MDYLDKIQLAADYIEDQLFSDIRGEDVACKTGFSLYHFHRIFQNLTGENLKSFIRKRRLSEAAKLLITTKKKIIEIAYDCQFETPESFSRAFKKIFGLNPLEYRQNRVNAHWIKMTEKLCSENLRLRIGQVALEPVIRVCPDLKVVGVSIYGAIDEYSINTLWKSFEQRISEIKNCSAGSIALGINYPFINQKFEFEYLAAMLVDEFSDIPAGMVSRIIPAHKYLIFSHHGPLENIKNTFNYISGTWIPNSRYQSSPDHPDFEWYDHRFQAELDESEVDVFFPIY